MVRWRFKALSNSIFCGNISLEPFSTLVEHVSLRVNTTNVPMSDSRGISFRARLYLSVCAGNDFIDA